MRRAHLIYEHPVFQEKYRALQEAERNRRFCKHTLEHFMDVARLMYIYALEHGLSVSKEVIYAMALMHDIGRIDQIEKGIPHEQAGAELCDIILPECGFAEEETEMIKAAVLCHRNAAGSRSDAEHRNAAESGSDAEHRNAAGSGSDAEYRNAAGSGNDAEHRNAAGSGSDPCHEMLFWADKRSRSCYACDMQKECNWEREKMNLEIDV